MMRIAIVNDLRMAVEALRRVVASVPAYEIAWIAEDGEQAVRMAAGDTPDVILMDLMMPRMDGAEATRRIMRASPCAILVVTATVDGHASKVFEAMGHGALDAVNTPVLGLSGEASGGADLLAKIDMLGRLLGKTRGRTAGPAVPSGAGHPATSRLPLIAIGASTGGPSALATVLRGLPPALSAAIVIVQHVDAHFAPGLASWLSNETGRDVRPIAAGDRPVDGRALLACTNDHLVLTSEGTYRYTVEPADYPYRPSVDVCFQSLVAHWNGPIVGVLLTGMGADGAEGLLAIRRAGGRTIAQDEGTSVVYGMPKAAARLGAAAEILPIDRIAECIRHRVSV